MSYTSYILLIIIILHYINNIILIKIFAGIEKAEVLSTGENEDDHQAKECLQEGVEKVQES